MVAIVDFGAFSGGAPVWKDKTELTELVTNQRWQTPSLFEEDTLAVYLNGQVLDRFSDNGFTVIDDETFELKIAIPTSHPFVLFVSYTEK